MRFEDTNLPDVRAVRTAFMLADADARSWREGTPDHPDDGLWDGSLSRLVRAGEILAQTVPGAHPEQIAAAMLCTLEAFRHPEEMENYTPILAQVWDWSCAWEIVRRSGVLPAHPQLGQIFVASCVAKLEGIRKNVLSDVVHPSQPDVFDIPTLLFEMDYQVRMWGNIQAPALTERHKTLRAEIRDLFVGRLIEPPQTPGYGFT